MKRPISGTKHRTLAVSAVSAALLLSLGSGYAVAKSDQNSKTSATKAQTELTDNETIADHAGWNNPKLAPIASHGGRVLLRQMLDVQESLNTGNVDGARHALKAAEDFAETLKPMMPYTVISDHVRDGNAKVVASDAGVAVDQMLPIYGDTTTVTAYEPETGTKASAKHQKTEKLDAVAADVDSQVVYLPVLYMEQQAELASKALDRNPPDTKAATQAVQNALDSLVIGDTNVHLLPTTPADRTS